MSDFIYATAVEYDELFETCVPLEFHYGRNTEPSPGPDWADTYQQKIEPAGLYLLHTRPGPPTPGWMYGYCFFECPLVIAFNPNPNEVYGPTSWKARLFQLYHATGRELTAALVADGYDAIVTVRGPTETSEIVALRPGLCY